MIAHRGQELTTLFPQECLRQEWLKKTLILKLLWCREYQITSTQALKTTIKILLLAISNLNTWTLIEKRRLKEPNSVNQRGKFSFLTASPLVPELTKLLALLGIIWIRMRPWRYQRTLQQLRGWVWPQLIELQGLRLTKLKKDLQEGTNLWRTGLDSTSSISKIILWVWEPLMLGSTVLKLTTIFLTVVWDLPTTKRLEKICLDSDSWVGNRAPPKKHKKASDTPQWLKVFRSLTMAGWAIWLSEWGKLMRGLLIRMNSLNWVSSIKWI